MRNSIKKTGAIKLSSFFCSPEILIYDYKLENNKNTDVVSFMC